MAHFGGHILCVPVAPTGDGSVRVTPHRFNVADDLAPLQRRFHERPQFPVTLAIFNEQAVAQE